MEKHTAGPWETRPSSNKNNGSDWRDIVSLGGEFSPSYVGEALDRDASLIAAAPDLLEVLQETFDNEFYHCNCGKTCEGTCTYARVKAAITKATGEAQ
jgi:hypothetical protein